MPVNGLMLWWYYVWWGENVYVHSLKCGRGRLWQGIDLNLIERDPVVGAACLLVGEE